MVQSTTNSSEIIGNSSALFAAVTNNYHGSRIDTRHDNFVGPATNRVYPHLPFLPANGSLATATSTEMQHETSNGADEKLADHNGKVAAYANGGRVPAPLFLDKTDREIVRLIGQHLKIIGLE